MRDLQELLEEIEHRASERRYFAYELAYPENMGGAVFYVGKGTDYRIDHHENEAKRGVQSPKCDVIRSIWTAGEQVVKRKVAEHLTNSESLDIESTLIQRYGIENLTNIPPARAIPQEESIIPASITIYKSFRKEIEESIRRCMKQEGIDLSSHECHQYLQVICMQAIRSYCSQHQDQSPAPLS